MPVPQRSRPIKSDNFGKLFSKLKPTIYSESGRPTGISNLRHIAWSPTGTGIATCTGSVIRVWNPERATVRASQELRVTPVSGGPGGPVGVVEKLAWNPIKEAELASTGSDGAVRLWDVRVGTGGLSAGKGSVVQEAKVGDSGLFLCWRPDGREIVVGRRDDVVVAVDVRMGMDGVVERLDVQEGRKASQGQTNQMCFSNTGREVFATTGEGSVRVLDWPTMQHLHTLNAHTSAAYSVAYSPNGSTLAVGGGDSLITLWDTQDWTCKHTLAEMTGAVHSLSFSFDGTYIVGANGPDKDAAPGLEISCVETGEHMLKVETKNVINVAAWHPLRYWLAYAGDPGGLHVIGVGSSPNERRCISRQDLGYYRTLVVGAIYSSSYSPDSPLQQCTELNKRDPSPFVPALKHCIFKHPILGAAIVGADTEAPEFVTPLSLDLRNHIEIWDRESFRCAEKSEADFITSALTQVSDASFPSGDDMLPPWKIVVAPLATHGEKGERTRSLVLFAYYHSHGDGKSGLAFHTTFLEGLNIQKETPDASESDDYFICDPYNKSLLPPIEKAGNLSVSWTYLLSPLLGAYLPTSISTALGFRASAIPQSDCWRGQKVSFDPSNFRTGVQMLMLSLEHTDEVLRQCRAKGVTFTGLLHQLIVRVLSDSLPFAAFSSQTAVDMRRQLKGTITDDDMALCPTAYYEVFPCASPDDWIGWTTSSTAAMWDHARKTSEGLAECAGRLRDQPIGLLPYLNKIRPWLSGQVGKEREASYEVSNLVIFNPAIGTEQAQDPSQMIVVEQVVFAQPANVTGACLNFNVVSTKDGPMVLTVTWQRGILNLDDGMDEDEFVAGLCGHLGTHLRELASAA